MIPPHLAYLVYRRISPTNLIRLCKADRSVHYELQSKKPRWWLRRGSLVYYLSLLRNGKLVELIWYDNLCKSTPPAFNWSQILGETKLRGLEIREVHRGNFRVCYKRTQRAKDPKGLIKSCLIYASNFGHLSVILYIINKFALSLDDLKVDFSGMLRYAAENGHLSLVRLLVEDYGFTAVDVHSVMHFAFTTAAVNGHLPVIQYFYQMGVTVDTIGDTIVSSEHLRRICQGWGLN